MSIREQFARPQQAISDIRTRSYAAGVSMKEFDQSILPRLDDLVQMEIVTPPTQNNAAGYDVVFTIDEPLLDRLLLPFRAIDTNTAEIIRAKVRAHRASLPKGERRLPYFVVDQIITDLIEKSKR